MRHRLFRLFCVILLCPILFGCSGSSPQQIPLPTRSVTLNQDFTLRVGQDARLEEENLTVILRAVADDSRCPEDAQCVWEGNARVQVELKKASQLGAVLDLNTSPRLDPREVPYLIYTVELVSVAPNTRLSRTINPSDYVIGMRVRKP